MAERESIANLFSTLFHDVSLIIRKEFELAKTETGEKVAQVSNGAIFLAAGGIVAFAGLLYLMLAAVYALANMMPNWAAALIVGGIVAIIGVVMLMSGRNKLKAGSLAPNRTIHSLNKDAALVRHHTTSEASHG